MTDQTFPPFELPKTEMPKKRRGPKPGAKKRAKSVFEQGINQRHAKESIAKLEAPIEANQPEFITSLIKVLDGMPRDIAIAIVQLLTRIYA